MVTGMNLSKMPGKRHRRILESQGSLLELRHKHCKRHGQASRPISTSQLNALLRLHMRPINLVVYKGSLGRLSCGRRHLEACFTLRCFQRLSFPDVATQLYYWRNNWFTRGLSIPVLSY